jgi:glycosyltransferase involved in cell wall biosynthesis
MRIACIATSSVPSRRANSVRVMKACQSFLDLGHDAHLWLPGRRREPDWERLKRHYALHRTFPITWIPRIRALRHWDYCVRAVLDARRWGADLLYAWPYQAATFASRLNIPTVLEVHDRPQGRFGPWLFRMFLQGGGARRLLPITEALRAYLAETYGVPLEPPFAVITPSGVDLRGYASLPSPVEARSALDLPEKLTAGYTGHLYPGRGVDLLFDLARRNPEFSFVWAGGEEQAVEHWRRKLADAEIENVNLLGFVLQEKLPLVQAACDVMLMPYARRIAVSGGGDTARFASPMKAFEYLAVGKAILTSDLPVLHEILNESNAVFVPPEDVERWDAALKALAMDPARRQALAEQARRDAAQYSWEARARRALAGLDVEDSPNDD